MTNPRKRPLLLKVGTPQRDPLYWYKVGANEGYAGTAENAHVAWGSRHRAGADADARDLFLGGWNSGKHTRQRERVENPFWGFGKRKPAPTAKSKGRACARSSTMSIGDAIHAARAAGRASGDTGAFTAWACRKGLDQKGNAFYRRLEAAYREGVEEPQDAPTPRQATAAQAPRPSRELPSKFSSLQSDVVEALVSMKMKRKEAEERVRSASGDNFDSLFRSALRRGNPAPNPSFQYVDIATARPIHEVRNHKFHSALVDSMRVKGWQGRPLLGITCDPQEEWGVRGHTGGCGKVEVEMLTGAHRFGALAYMQEHGEWPTNLPEGRFPAVVLGPADFKGRGWQKIRDAAGDDDRLDVLEKYALDPAVIALMEEEHAFSHNKVINPPQGIQSGGYIKALFEGKDSRGVIHGERMWVVVSRVSRGIIHGKLDNQPAYIRDMKLGTRVEVPVGAVIEHRRNNPQASDAAHARALSITRDPAFSTATPAAQAVILTLQRSTA